MSHKDQHLEERERQTIRSHFAEINYRIRFNEENELGGDEPEAQERRARERSEKRLMAEFWQREWAKVRYFKKRGITKNTAFERTKIRKELNQGKQPRKKGDTTKSLHPLFGGKAS